MKRLGIVILTTIGLAGCTSNFAGPAIESGHPAHPDSAHTMVPAPPSPFNLQPPFLPLADDAEMHDMHMMHGEAMPDGDASEGSSDEDSMRHNGHAEHNHGGDDS